MNLRLTILMTWLLWLCIGPADACHAQDSQRIAGIKSAYIRNFLKYTEWPVAAFEDERSPIVVAVVGKQALDGVLERVLSDTTINNRRVQVRRLDYPLPDAGAEAAQRFRTQIQTAHLLFIDSSQRRHIPALLEMVRGKDVLTVSDASGFCESGGMLGVIMRENHIVLDANPNEINRTNLRVSSKVLRLARIVETERE